MKFLPRHIADNLGSEHDPASARLLAEGLLSHARMHGYPVFQDASTAILLYEGEGAVPLLLGDMTQWSDPIPFERILGTTLSFFRGQYEPEARLEYILQQGEAGPLITDPRNPDRVHGFVLNSELAMPAYRRNELFQPYRDGTMGSYAHLQEMRLPAGVLPYGHTVHVQLPPGDAPRHDGFPAVYFQDGRDYIEYGAASDILDMLMRRNAIEPLIGVFVTPPNLHQPQTPNRTTEYGMNDAYVQFFAEELVSYIDARFPTNATPRRRLIVGDSYGGLISAYIAFRRPDRFAGACSQSGYFSFRRDGLIKLLESEPHREIELFLDCGTYERRVGAGFVPASEGDFLEANRRAAAVLGRRKYRYVYREYPEGHTWGNWRAHLVDALKHFFGKPA